MEALIASFLLGVGSAASPCLLPLYPAFLAFLVGRSEVTGGGSRSAALFGLFVVLGVITALIAVGATLLLVVGAAREWTGDREAFRQEVLEGDGIVVANDVLPSDNDGLWGWTALYLSLVVRSDPDDAILVDRNPSYIPFTPDEARRGLDDAYVWPR